MVVDIALLVVMMILAQINAQICTENAVKSNHQKCISYNRYYDCDAFGYETLYFYILCKDIHLEVGKEISILNRQSDNFKYIIFQNSTIPNIPAGVFTTSLNSAKEVYLNNSKIRSLDPGAFAGMTNLKKLELQNNNITEITRGSLNSLTKLEILDLTNNNLAKIEDNSFHGLLALQTLKLSENYLVNVTTSTLSSLNDLTFLNLSYNHIRKIEDQSFSNFAKLQQLLLNNNMLENIPVLIFKNLVSLRILDIAFNKIREFDFNFLNYTLRTLKLNNNKIIHIQNWSKLKNINTVDLGHNDISVLETVGNGIVYLQLNRNNIKSLGSSIFSQSKGLLKLSLDYNYIKSIQWNSFDSLSELQFLYLNHNQLDNLPLGCFKDLTALKILDLSFNYLTNLEYGTFYGLSNIETLSLNNNQLVVIYENSFHVFGQLTTLYLSDNILNELDPIKLLHQLKTLKDITLNNNNWTCNSLVITINTFKARNVTIGVGHNYDVPNVNGIQCRNDNELIQSNIDGSLTTAADVETASFSNTEYKKSKLNISSAELFCTTGFYEFFDKAYKNASFFKFFESNYTHNKFTNYLEKGFNDSKLFKYFDETFVNSLFYRFFNTDFMRTGVTKYLDHDFINTRFFQYFEQDFFDSSFFKYFNQTLKNTTHCFSDTGIKNESVKQFNSQPLKLTEQVNTRNDLEANITKIIFLFWVIIILLVIIIITLFSMFLLLFYRANIIRGRKVDENKSILESNMELL